MTGVFCGDKEFEGDAVSTKRCPHGDSMRRHSAVGAAFLGGGGVGGIEVPQFTIEAVWFAADFDAVYQAAQEGLFFFGGSVGEDGLHFVQNLLKQGGRDLGNGMQGGQGRICYFLALVGFEGFEFSEAFEQGGGMFALGDGVGDVVDLAADFSKLA